MPDAPAGKESAILIPRTERPGRTRFFQPSDWWAAATAGVLVLLVYLFTMAPDVTLEDSGELAVGAYYAGVPHPPGYPVWTIYSWFFTKVVPFSNIAWRVTLGSAFAGACSCALLALMVSRGTTMMLEGMRDFRELDRRRGTWIAVVSGTVAGMLMGFNGFMWSQAVIVEVYTLSVFSLMGMLACLMRWMHNPGRRRYLYWTFFLFGICFNNHQSLVVAAIGLEIAIAAADRSLGRDLFLGNVIVYVLGLVAKLMGWIEVFDQNWALFIIYNLVGIGSIAAFLWLWSVTIDDGLFDKRRLWCCLGLLGVWLLGLSFYLYLPIASSTNPPMNWGYPRTWDGFLHTFFRQQYEQPNPTIKLDSLNPQDIVRDLILFIQQMWMYVKGAAREFNPLLLCLAAFPFLLIGRMDRRSRSWLVGLTGVFFCLAVILMILLNPPPDRQSQELNRVFFTPSHTIIAILMGHGLGLITALLAVRYRELRMYGILGGALAVVVAGLIWLDPLDGYEAALRRVHPLDTTFAMLLLVCTGAFAAALALNRQRLPLVLVLAIFSLLPVQSLLSNWWVNEKRGHLFGFWFGHDMFEPPFDLYPPMERGAILYGGTDPGRFNPTYMIFCESFLSPSRKRDPDFDRRDVYIITQNALADETYLDYIRAHYSRSNQIDPPFFQEMLGADGKRTNRLARMAAPLDRAMSRFGARVEASRRAAGIYPEEELVLPIYDDLVKAIHHYWDITGKRGDLGREAVNSVNGTLTRQIFEENPDREFYIEESFVLGWMFPHLSPYGIILRLNRREVPRITGEMMERDREFWDRYMERLIGPVVREETTIEELREFALDAHLRGDLAAFPGDPRFLRDDWARKAYAKLRSAVAGVYTWRVSPDCPPHLRPTGEENRAALVREADYAFRQALALCPYSAEVAFRYADFLRMQNRIDDAVEVVDICYRFDPENRGIRGLRRQLEEYRDHMKRTLVLQEETGRLMEAHVRDPADLDAATKLVGHYIAMGDTNRAVAVLRTLAAQENLGEPAFVTLISAYMGLRLYEDLEGMLLRYAPVATNKHRVWFDLGATQALLGKNSEALRSLARAMELGHAAGEADTLRKLLREDARLNRIRSLPAFRPLLADP